jgi:peptidoglycan hydrolase FlgJ
MLPTPVPTSAIDLKGLEELRHRAAREDPKALAEAAVQFEALFIGLMLKSARDASLGEGILDGPQTVQYLELMDQQVALELARNGGFGFGKLLLEQLGGDAGTDIAPTTAPARLARPRVARESIEKSPVEPAIETPEDFVARFLPDATEAAKALGIEPRLLLAQVALETGWGAGPVHADGRASNNLFGIKAGGGWRGARVAQWTIEHTNGVAERKREQFRAYPSAAESFTDYVELISNTPRYAAALDQAHDAEAYARAVTAAGYATDPDYADKWLSIYHGERLGGALSELKLAESEPTQ